MQQNIMHKFASQTLYRQFKKLTHFSVVDTETNDGHCDICMYIKTEPYKPKMEKGQEIHTLLKILIFSRNMSAKNMLVFSTFGYQEYFSFHMPIDEEYFTYQEIYIFTYQEIYTPLLKIMYIVLQFSSCKLHNF